MNKNTIISRIEFSINDWKKQREKIGKDEFKNYLHCQHIDYSICDIVIQELLELLKYAKGEKDDEK